MNAGPASPEPSTLETWLVPTAQNRPKHSPTMPVLQGSPCLQVWEKASTVRVSVGRASWATGPKAKPVGLLAATEAITEAIASEAKGKDGRVIGTLSKGSRRRLMEKLATIDATAPALFVTLTWPTWAAPDREQWHRAWDRWRKRFDRSWPDAAGIWRREYTRAGVVHLHLLVFNVPIDRVTIRQLQEWTARAWADVVEAPEYERRRRVGTSVEVPRIGAAVSRYIAKYATKVAAGDGTERPMGRWWGTFGEEQGQPPRIPYTLPTDVPLTEAEGHAIRRIMERWLQAKRRHRERVTGRRIKGRPPRPRASRRIFTDNPAQWLRVLALIREPSQVPPVGVSRRVREGEAGALATMGAADDATAVAVNMNVLDPQRDETPKDAKDYRRR